MFVFCEQLNDHQIPKDCFVLYSYSVVLQISFHHLNPCSNFKNLIKFTNCIRVHSVIQRTCNNCFPTSTNPLISMRIWKVYIYIYIYIYIADRICIYTLFRRTKFFRISIYRNAHLTQR